MIVMRIIESNKNTYFFSFLVLEFDLSKCILCIYLYELSCTNMLKLKYAVTEKITTVRRIESSSRNRTLNHYQCYRDSLLGRRTSLDDR